MQKRFFENDNNGLYGFKFEIKCLKNFAYFRSEIHISQKKIKITTYFKKTFLE